jgi:alcohol dehydrogenase class IV
MCDAAPMHFDFLAPARIVFGWGRRTEIGSLARTVGRRAFVVTGSRTLQRNGALSEIEDCLRRAGIIVERLASISREPEGADVDAAVDALSLRSIDAGDMLIAVGGGSAIDLAKAAAALATNPRGAGVKDYLEGVGKGLQLTVPPLPLIAVPTTAGTGSEATKNAVISSADPPFKKSLRSDLMVPRIALVDPELTTALPAEVTAHTGMDAITQLIESYLSRRAQPIPQALAISGLMFALSAIVPAVADGKNRPARERMAYAALLSGMALANSGLGLAHGVAAALGIHCRISHGLACAVMLPAALRVNIDVRSRELARLSTLLDLETPARSNEEAAEAFIAHLETIARRIGIPTRLSEIGVNRVHIPALVQGSLGNSMDGNPRSLGDEELGDLLEQML